MVGEIDDNNKEWKYVKYNTNKVNYPVTKNMLRPYWYCKYM